jgi:signal transduction histidine kinase/ligand-binding sensor domain-containing protein
VRAAAVPCATALLACLTPLPALALSPDKGLAQCSLQRWDAKNGLPSAAVRAIAQGADGALWVATLGGVVRYDGVRFAAIPSPPPPQPALMDVNKILVTRDGAVWLGSPFREPVRILGGSVQAFGPGTALPAGAIPSAWVEDSGGQLWMATPRGLFRFDGARFQPAAGGSGTTTRLESDTAGAVWQGTTEGLFLADGATAVADPRVKSAVTALHRDRRGVLWVATPGRLLGLERTGIVSLAAADGLPAAPIAEIDDDEDGNLWLGTPAGLVRVRAGRARLFTVADGLPDNDVTSVLVDREGSLWIGTRTGGIVQATDRTLDTVGLPAALDGIEVPSVCQDDEGAMWFGTRGRGAVRWKDGASVRYTSADGLPGDVIYAVTPGRPGEVWLGTPNGLAHWQAGRATRSSLWERPVRALYRAPGGTLWIGGDGELGRLAGGTVEVIGKDRGMLGGQVRAMAEDPRGNLWVSAVGGLVRLQEASGRLVRVAPLEGKRAGFVRSMLADRAGRFWLTTTRIGLVRLQDGAGRFFDAGVGLDAGLLYQMLEDDAGDIWMGSNRSVVRVSGSSLDAVAAGRRSSVEVTSFDATDRGAGVVAETIRQPAAWKARDGRLWFATKSGVVSIDPKRVRPNVVPPHPVIEAVLVDGRPVATSAPASLAAGTRQLEFQYAGIALLQPNKVRYRYRLEGLDPDWVQAGDRRSARYAGVPPGSYRFQLQASNSDGLWSERATAFAFTVATPLHRQYWFWLVCLTGLLPALLLLHRIRVARLRAQYLGMLTERARVARELHDTLLQGLTAVTMQVNAARSRLPAQAQGAQRDLAEIQESVARCLSESRRAVRGLREPEAAADDLGPALSRLAERLQGPSAVACEVAVEGTPRPLPHAVKDELYRVGQEAITNAFKHAGATRIEARLRYDAGQVVMTITDDGRGFAPQEGAPGEHFGLVGIRERVARIGATLDIRSAPGAGTVVEVVASDAAPR